LENPEKSIYYYFKELITYALSNTGDFLKTLPILSKRFEKTAWILKWLVHFVFELMETN
jgi:hypothetical protein